MAHTGYLYGTLPKKKMEISRPSEECSQWILQRDLEALAISEPAPVPPPRIKHMQKKFSTLPSKSRLAATQRNSNALSKGAERHEAHSPSQYLPINGYYQDSWQGSDCDIVACSQHQREELRPDVLPKDSQPSLRGQMRAGSQRDQLAHSTDSDYKVLTSGKTLNCSCEAVDGNQNLVSKYETNMMTHKSVSNSSFTSSGKAVLPGRISKPLSNSDRMSMPIPETNHSCGKSIVKDSPHSTVNNGSGSSRQLPLFYQPDRTTNLTAEFEPSCSGKARPIAWSTPKKPSPSSVRSIADQDLTASKSPVKPAVLASQSLVPSCSPQDLENMMRYYNLSLKPPSPLTANAFQENQRNSTPYGSNASLNVSGEDVQVVLRRKKKVKIRPSSFYSDDDSKKRVSLEISLTTPDHGQEVKPSAEAGATKTAESQLANSSYHLERINLEDMTSTETAKYLKKQFNKLKVKANSLKVKDTELKQRFLILQSKRGRVTGGGVTKAKSRNSSLDLVT